MELSKSFATQAEKAAFQQIIYLSHEEEEKREERSGESSESDRY